MATKWCVERLYEAAKGWAPIGRKWWGKWMAMLEQWVRDDSLRLQHKKMFGWVWECWEDRDVFAARAVEALVTFGTL